MNMATAVPRASPATSSGFALATSTRRNDVATKNVDRMVLGLPNAAKVVIVVGRGGAGIINNVLLSVCGDRPVSGHHARTQRGGQRVGPAYGTPAGCCFGACPEKAAENHHNGLDNEGAQRCVQRKHGAGDDVRAVRPPSRVEGRVGTPVGAQRGEKSIV